MNAGEDFEGSFANCRKNRKLQSETFVFVFYFYGFKNVSTPVPI